MAANTEEILQKEFKKKKEDLKQLLDSWKTTNEFIKDYEAKLEAKTLTPDMNKDLLFRRDKKVALEKDINIKKKEVTAAKSAFENELLSKMPVLETVTEGDLVMSRNPLEKKRTAGTEADLDIKWQSDLEHFMSELDFDEITMKTSTAIDFNAIRKKCEKVDAQLFNAFLMALVTRGWVTSKPYGVTMNVPGYRGIKKDDRGGWVQLEENEPFDIVEAVKRDLDFTAPKAIDKYLPDDVTYSRIVKTFRKEIEDKLSKQRYGPYGVNYLKFKNFEPYNGGVAWCTTLFNILGHLVIKVQAQRIDSGANGGKTLMANWFYQHIRRHKMDYRELQGAIMALNFRDAISKYDFARVLKYLNNVAINEVDNELNASTETINFLYSLGSSIIEMLHKDVRARVVPTAVAAFAKDNIADTYVKADYKDKDIAISVDRIAIETRKTIDAIEDNIKLIDVLLTETTKFETLDKLNNDRAILVARWERMTKKTYSNDESQLLVLSRRLAKINDINVKLSKVEDRKAEIEIRAVEREADEIEKKMRG